MNDELLSVAEIADELELTPHRVAYAIKRSGIQERRRVGMARMFGRDQIDDITRSLIEARMNKVSKWDPYYQELQSMYESVGAAEQTKNGPSD